MSAGFTVQNQQMIADRAIAYFESRSGTKSGLGSKSTEVTHDISQIVLVSEEVPTAAEKLDTLKKKIKASLFKGRGCTNWIRDDMKSTRATLLMDEKSLAKTEPVDATSSSCYRGRILAAVKSDFESIAEHMEGSAAMEYITSYKSTGKAHKEVNFDSNSESPKSSGKAPERYSEEKTVEEPLPLYKIISKGDRVLARYSDGKFYPATVKTTMQKGYSSAIYDIQFDGYNNIDTVSWKDCMRFLSVTEPERVPRWEGVQADKEMDEFGRDVKPPIVHLVQKPNNSIETATAVLPNSEKNIRKRSRWDVVPFDLADSNNNDCIKEIELASEAPNDDPKNTAEELLNPSLLVARNVGKWKIKKLS